MKSAFTISALLFIIILAGGCKKKQETYVVNGDYFIFGRSGGFTTPETKTTFYLVNNNQLRADTTQLAQNSSGDVRIFRFNYVLPADKYNAVADLPGAIPPKMLVMNNSTIGTTIPDAGYMDIRASIGGAMYMWHVEGMLDSTDATIRTFVERCKTAFN